MQLEQGGQGAPGLSASTLDLESVCVCVCLLLSLFPRTDLFSPSILAQLLLKTWLGTLVGDLVVVPSTAVWSHFTQWSLDLQFLLFSPALQYYEMSYGLNIEMHKQVGGRHFQAFKFLWRVGCCRALPSVTAVVFQELEMP